MQPTARSQHAIMPGPVRKPLRIGVRKKPPCLVLDYLVLATGEKRRRFMPMRGADCAAIVENITARHIRFLKDIPKEQITKAISWYMQQSDTIDVSKNIRVPAFGVPVGEEDEDLNKLDEAGKALKQAEMDVFFQKNQSKKGDAAFQYDVQKAFKPNEESGWDSNSDESEIDEEIDEEQW